MQFPPRVSKRLFWRASVAGLSAVAVASVSAFSAATPALSASINLAPNRSFERAAEGLPSCWQLGRSGPATAVLTRSRTAHSGAASARLSVSRLSPGATRGILISLRARGCAPAVSAGQVYTLGTWYQATSPVVLSVYYRTSPGRWSKWVHSRRFPASKRWAYASMTTPPVPAGAQALSFGPSLSAAGVLRADDAAMKRKPTTHPQPSTQPSSQPSSQPSTQPSTQPIGGATYDSIVLADHPRAMWDMTAGGSSEPDLTGAGNTGSYVNGTPVTASMPNGDRAAVFNGSNQYMTVPSSSSLSIPNPARQLTWEAWIRPDVLQFPTATNGYTDFLGKCGLYYHYCEYEGRMYNSVNSQNRCNRISAYVFNLQPTSAGLGSAADWQPNCNMLQAGHWYHVVGEYRTDATPYSACSSAYPGIADIWVNGVKWNQAYHGDTGCMSQHSIVPQAGPSPFVVGTLAQYDYFFQGAVGKVAIYDTLLTQSQIDAHYVAMTGQQPAGSCADTCTLANP